jgi:hypothetical protein
MLRPMVSQPVCLGFKYASVAQVYLYHRQTVEVLLICRLQLLLALASALILGSEFRGTHDHILLYQIRDSPTWRAGSPYLYTPGTG